MGVDEAGRGPLAGPVAVGIVAVPSRFNWKLIEGVVDSKQMTELGREIWYEKVRILEREEELRYRVVFSSVKVIDYYGIVRAVKRALHKGVRAIAPNPIGIRILLDGLLTAPPEYAQKTIIRGDETEPLIALASILAKVRRDRLMRAYALHYPGYSFEAHKGYGTKGHYAAIEKYGLCDIHRRTFCKVDQIKNKGIITSQ